MGVYAEHKEETLEQTNERISKLLGELKTLEVRGGQLTQEQDDLADDISHELLGALVRRSKDDSMLALSVVARLAAQVLVGPSADLSGSRVGTLLLQQLVEGHLVMVWAERHLQEQEDKKYGQRV